MAIRGSKFITVLVLATQLLSLKDNLKLELLRRIQPFKDYRINWPLVDNLIIPGSYHIAVVNRICFNSVDHSGHVLESNSKVSVMASVYVIHMQKHLHDVLVNHISACIYIRVKLNFEISLVDQLRGEIFRRNCYVRVLRDYSKVYWHEELVETSGSCLNKKVEGINAVVIL